jgi:hypothetical protein
MVAAHPGPGAFPPGGRQQASVAPYEARVPLSGLAGGTDDRIRAPGQRIVGVRRPADGRWARDPGAMPSIRFSILSPCHGRSERLPDADLDCSPRLQSRSSASWRCPASPPFPRDLSARARLVVRIRRRPGTPRRRPRPGTPHRRPRPGTPRRVPHTMRRRRRPQAIPASRLTEAQRAPHVHDGLPATP